LGKITAERWRCLSHSVRLADEVLEAGAVVVCAGGWAVVVTVITDILSVHVTPNHTEFIALRWPSVAHDLLRNILAVGIGFAIGVGTILLARWRQRAADAIDRIAIRRVSRFDREYREFIRAGSHYIDQKGQTIVSFYTPELDDVYVDVSLKRSAPQDVPAGMLDKPSYVDASPKHRALQDMPAGMPNESPHTDTERLELGKFLDDREPVLLAIVGGPGSGKSTLLRHTARHVDRHRPHRNVPILLILRDHASKIVEQPDIEMGDLIRSSIGGLKAKEPVGWFEQKLRKGNCIVLLDGLDEVSRQQDRQVIAKWIEQQVRQYQNNHFVIASRPHGYRVAPVAGARVLQVRSFTVEQVERFINRWYRAIERNTIERNNTPKDSIAKANSRADRAAADLLSRINSNQALSDLAVNPLLLTMVANVHRFRGRLPGTRADLYKEICEVMLSQRPEAKDLASELSGPAKLALVAELAYAMMSRRVPYLPQKETVRVLGQVLRRVSQTMTVEDFMADVSYNGILVERETAQYSFAHLTLQEYLAAAYIQAKGLANNLARYVNDTWWYETSLLYSAHADADVIVAACLKSTNATALALALDCLSQPVNLAPSLRNQLDILAASAFAPETETHRRQLITRALLTRHLLQRLRVPDNSISWSRPITANLYWLYLQDTGGKGMDGHAPSWGDETLALGICRNDVASFVRWVNQAVEEKRSYRLPKTNELSDMVFSRLLGPDSSYASGKEKTIWASGNDSGRPEVCTLKGQTHPYHINAEILLSHLEADTARAFPAIAALVMLRLSLVSRFMARQLGHTTINEREQAAALADSMATDLLNNSEPYAYAHKAVRELRQLLDNDGNPPGSRLLKWLFFVRYLLKTRRSSRLIFQAIDMLDRDIAFLRVVSGRQGGPVTYSQGADSPLGNILRLDEMRDIILGAKRDANHPLSADRINSTASMPALNEIIKSFLPSAIASAVSASIESRDLAKVFSVNFFNQARVRRVRIAADERVVHGAYAPGLPPVVVSDPEHPSYSSAVVDVDMIVYSDELISNLRTVVTALNTGKLGAQGSLRVLGAQGPLRVVGTSKASGLRSWAIDIGNRLLEYAVPVLDGLVQLDPEIAACIRMTALWLAAYAQDATIDELAEPLFKIVAGITVLERRTSGEIPVSEVIMLIPE
jgi:hypothetical protein